MTHPMLKGLTRAQRRTFEGWLYCDPSRSRHPRTLAALVERGLLASEEKRKATPLGDFVYVDHYVPLEVHAAYHLMAEWDDEGNVVAVCGSWCARGDVQRRRSR